NIIAFQFNHETINPHFLPVSSFTHSYSPPSLGYVDANSAHISALGTKYINENRTHTSIAPKPRPKLDAVDLAIHLIPYRADTFINTKSHKPIFLFSANIIPPLIK